MSYILNPKTNRMIMVGGKPWRTLIKEGLISNQLDSEEEQSTESPQSSLINAKVPLRERDARPNRGPAKKRYFTQQRTGKDGQKKDVRMRKKPKQEEIADYTAQCASRTIHKHMDALSDQLQGAYESDELDSTGVLSAFEENLKNLILEEMLTGEANKPPNRYMNETRQKKVEENYAYEEESEPAEYYAQSCEAESAEE